MAISQLSEDLGDAIADAIESNIAASITDMNALRTDLTLHTPNAVYQGFREGPPPYVNVIEGGWTNNTQRIHSSRLDMTATFYVAVTASHPDLDVLRKMLTRYIDCVVDVIYDKQTTILGALTNPDGVHILPVRRVPATPEKRQDRDEYIQRWWIELAAKRVID